MCPHTVCVKACQELKRRISDIKAAQSKLEETVVTVWLEGPLEVGNCTVETSLKTSYQEGLYTARTVVQDQQEVTVRIMNNIY